MDEGQFSSRKGARSDSDFFVSWEATPKSVLPAIAGEPQGAVLEETSPLGNSRALKPPNPVFLRPGSSGHGRFGEIHPAAGAPGMQDALPPARSGLHSPVLRPLPNQKIRTNASSLSFRRRAGFSNIELPN